MKKDTAPAADGTYTLTGRATRSHPLLPAIPATLFAVLAADQLRPLPQKSPLLGLSFALPEGTFGAVVARSGLASKQGLRPANCLGVIDSDYRGECFVALHNDSNEERTVRHGDRVAQLVLLPFLPMEFEQVDTLPETVRGEGGFGSTGR